MNNFLNVCLVIVFTFGVSNLVHSQCNTMGAKGGKCIQRGSTEFVEDTVYQFQFEFTYDQYQNLLDAYKLDPNFNTYRVAGLGFVPVIDTLQVTTLAPDTNQVNYETVGLRTVLVLWKGQVGSNGQNNPDEIVIFGFGEIEKAFSISAKKEPLNKEHFVQLISSTPLQQVVNDSLITNSREFDIVFLDSLEFEYLARSGDFYPNSDRPKNGNNNPIQGITIERAFGAITPGDSNDPHTNYRTLLFKPHPIPNLTGYNSEAAVAFRYGEHCPPFWIDQSESIEGCNESPANCFFKSAIQKRKVEIVEVGRGGGKERFIPWGRIIPIVLALLGITVFVTRALTNRQV